MTTDGLDAVGLLRKMVLKFWVPEERLARAGTGLQEAQAPKAMIVCLFFSAGEPFPNRRLISASATSYPCVSWNEWLYLLFVVIIRRYCQYIILLYLHRLSVIFPSHYSDAGRDSKC